MMVHQRQWWDATYNYVWLGVLHFGMQVSEIDIFLQLIIGADAPSWHWASPSVCKFGSLGSWVRLSPACSKAHRQL